MFLSDAPVYSASFLKTACVSSSVRGRIVAFYFGVRETNMGGSIDMSAGEDLVVIWI